MTKPMNINVRISGGLSEFVADNIGEHGDFESVSEYVRHLIREHKQIVEKERFETLKAELQRAFAAPDDQFVKVDREELLARIKRQRG